MFILLSFKTRGHEEGKVRNVFPSSQGGEFACPTTSAICRRLLQQTAIITTTQMEDSMGRSIVLGVLLAIGALSMVVIARQGAAPQAGGQQAAKVIEVEKLKENLYVLKGANSGGNTAVFITANGVVVVDAKNPGWGQPILDKIKTLA